MKFWLATIAALLGFASAAWAAPGAGDVLSALSLDDCGEIQLGGDEVSYHRWAHAGAPLLLHFMAARPGLGDENSDVLRHVLTQRPAMLPLTVTLINQQDAIWGTGGLIKGIIEGRKRELPHARMVIDCEGSVGKAWELPEGSSVLMLLDAEGEVRFVHFGRTPEERVLALIAEVDALGLTEAVGAGSSLH